MYHTVIDFRIVLQTWKVLVVRRSEMAGPSLRQSLRRSFSLANNCLIQALLTLCQGWNETSALWIGVLWMTSSRKWKSLNDHSQWHVNVASAVRGYTTPKVLAMSCHDVTMVRFWSYSDLLFGPELKCIKVFISHPVGTYGIDHRTIAHSCIMLHRGLNGSWGKSILDKMRCQRLPKGGFQ
jgi:hypothetical protein